MNKEYHSNYQRNRYEERLLWAISYLGGKCIKCDKDFDLQFDHIDPKTKFKNLTVMLSKYSIERIKEELDKCQLLCLSCHNLKTIEQTGRLIAKGFHGTISSYKYCRCELCREAKSKDNKIRNKKRPSRARVNNV